MKAIKEWWYPRQDKLKQLSLKYLFRNDKTVYYQVKVYTVNRIT